MYTIRVDTKGKRVDVHCSGRLNTGEAVRATTQVGALLDASGGMTDVLCDLTQVRRGPGSLLVIAAALASRHNAGYRIAFVVTPQQRRFVLRVVRYSGVRKGMVILRSGGDAVAWLEAGPQVTAHRLSATELRHAEHLLGSSTTAIAPSREESIEAAASEPAA